MPVQVPQLVLVPVQVPVVVHELTLVSAQLSWGTGTLDVLVHSS
jgi:hypothetical protein